MTIPRLRSAVRTALCIVLTAAGLSCDALNPTFVNQLGGTAINSVPEPNGSIVLVFNNQRSTTLDLTYTLEISPPGGPVTTRTLTPTNYGGYSFIMTHGCDVTKIEITSLAGPTATTQPATTQPSTGLAISGSFAAPNLQCGSVIFVNVPLVGAATVTLVP